MNVKDYLRFTCRVRQCLGYDARSLPVYVEDEVILPCYKEINYTLSNLADEKSSKIRVTYILVDNSLSVDTLIDEFTIRVIEHFHGLDGEYQYSIYIAEGS